jgi:hypothetical protein
MMYAMGMAATIFLFVSLGEELYRKLTADSEELATEKLLKALTRHAAILYPNRPVDIVTRRVKQPESTKAQWVAALREKPSNEGSATGMAGVLHHTIPNESKRAALGTLVYWIGKEAVKKELDKKTLKSVWVVQKVREEAGEKDEDVVWLEEE